MKYEQRVVVFIDILGFKSLLDETLEKDGSDNEEKINSIISAYNNIQDIWNSSENIEFLYKPSSKQVSIFSDSIVISFKVDEESQVFHTLIEIKWLIMRLLSQKILCRGAIAFGKFIHTDKFLFGPALIEAYILESKAAMYPRVILDKTVIDISVKNKAAHHTEKHELEYIYSLLDQDSDGMYFIDYFFKAREELDDPEYDFPSYIQNLGEVIRKGLRASSHHSKADLRVKYSWMRERYNKMVETVTNKKHIQNLRNYGENELADFYENLKKISPNKYNKSLQWTSH